MKLHEIKRLTETTGQYIVYKVSSPTTDQVYYGYSTDEDVKRTFITGARRQDMPDRGDVRMINAAGGEDNLRFSLLDVFADEIEAFMERNDLRAKDSASITGPTNFPVQMYQRAKQLFPERVATWRLEQDLRDMNARQAMSAGAFDYQSLVQIAGNDPEVKKEITRDLDLMKYPDFKAKYLM